MARTFDGSADELITSTSPITTFPVTMGAWYFSATDTAGNETILSIGKNSASELHAFCTIQARWSVNQGGAFYANKDVDPNVLISAGTITTSTWHHICGVFTRSGGNVTATLYVDGTSVGSDTQGEGTIETWDAIAIGRSADTTPGYGEGTVAWAGLWNVALTAPEIAALYKRAHPRMIRPAALKFGADLVGWGGASSNERDYIGGLTLAQTSSPGVAAQPAIILPAPFPRWSRVAVAPGGTTGILRQAIDDTRHGFSAVMAAQLNGVLVQ